MKKIIFLIFILNLISVSIVLSDDFSDYYPNECDVILNFNLNESKEYFNWAKDSMMDKTYNEVMSSLNKKLSVDFSKDIKEIRICFINVKMGFLSMDNSVPFFFIKGNFENKESCSSLINSLVKEITNEDAKQSKIKINDEEKQVFSARNIEFIQFSDNILFIGLNGSSSLIEYKKITFNKAPKSLINISQKAKTYAYFTRKNLWKIPFISNLFYESEHFTSVSAYIKDNVINLIGNIDDPKVIEKETSIFKNDVNKFYDNYKKIYDKEKKLLRKTPLNHFSIIAKRTYLDALYKKIIDNTKVTNNEDSIIVSIPLEKFLIKHTLFCFFNLGIDALNLNANNNTMLACLANQKVLTNALRAYNSNNNTELHYHFDFKNKYDSSEKEKDEYYDHRKIKERIVNPNSSGKTTMIIDIDTLLKNDCLDIEPIKPDPECEYVACRNFQLDDYVVYCLKHSFIVPTNRTNFGGVFRGGAYDPSFLNPGKKQILNSVNCYHFQKQLTESVSEYNKNHDSKMTKLDMIKLYEAGCLEKTHNKPNSNCEYYTYDDLSTNDGSIYCYIHGPESYKIGEEQIFNKLMRLRNIKLSKVDLDNIDINEIDTIFNCAYNLSSLYHGILRNNQDEKIKITNKLNIADLIKKEKIWRDPKKNNPNCDYYIEGDMTNGGRVVCKKHGYIIE